MFASLKGILMFGSRCCYTPGDTKGGAVCQGDIRCSCCNFMHWRYVATLPDLPVFCLAPKNSLSKLSAGELTST